MGEIGYNRHEYLYELLWWEIDAIVEGYHARCRQMWAATRWQTYHLMMVSMADIKEAGINSPKDLITFTWEEDGQQQQAEVDDEYVNEMQELIKAANKQEKRKKKAKH